MNRQRYILVAAIVLAAGTGLVADVSPTTSPSSPSTAPSAAAPTTATATAATTAPTTATATATTSASASATVPTTAPTTRVTAAVVTANPPLARHRKPAILPEEYAILANRSIFQRGSHLTRNTDESSGTPIPSGTGSSGTTATSQTKSNSPEESLVFEGSMEMGNQIIAFIEDRGAGKMLLVQDGDVIARGHVSNISLDSLRYAGKDGDIRIGVGQTLRGSDAAPAEDAGNAASTAAPAPPPTDSSGVPLTPGVVPTPGGAATTFTPPAPTGSDSILERLRQRRAAEQAAIQGK